jgi:hypothetical protein
MPECDVRSVIADEPVLGSPTVPYSATTTEIYLLDEVREAMKVARKLA